MNRVFKLPPLRRLVLSVLVLVPALAWAFVKPVRVLAPGLAGAVCIDEALCTDDPAQAGRARALSAEAKAFVEQNLAEVQGTQKLIFCSTQACADAFGLGGRSAVTLGTFGTVIGPRAWQPHYVRHEVIHHVQGERLGVLGLLFKPAWFVEGMAYSLSQDPRTPLAEPFESQRSQFSAWYGSIDRTQVWQQAGKL